MADKSVLIMPGEVTGAQALTMQAALGRRSNGGRTRSTRRKRASRTGATRKPRTSARGGKRSRTAGTTKRGSRSRLVKGSAAAKRYMARIRKMRKR